MEKVVFLYIKAIYTYILNSAKKDIYNSDPSGCLEGQGEERDESAGFRADWLFLRIQGW